MTKTERELLLAVAHTAKLGNKHLNALIEKVSEEDGKEPAPAPARQSKSKDD